MVAKWVLPEEMELSHCEQRTLDSEWLDSGAARRISFYWR
jgi:hypothetical protein